MVGYQQLLTDPASYGLIVVATFPLIGNYGVNKPDSVSEEAYAAGYVVRELCDEPSNYRCEASLPDFLKENAVVTLTGVDTRSITRHIRETGEQKGVIVTYDSQAGIDIEELKKELSQWQHVPREIPHFAGSVGAIDAATPVSCKLAVLDLGMGYDVTRMLASMGVSLITFSPDRSPESILSQNPDGILISNGGGSPTDYEEAVKTVKQFASVGIPMLGVGIGHLVLALATGGEISHLHSGHRGANQPVYCLQNGRTYITSQNHGFIVAADKLPSGAELSYRNSNDQSVEGLHYKDINADSVQFMPDTTHGKQATRFVYEDFIALVLARKGK